MCFIFFFIIFSILNFLGSSDRDMCEHEMILIYRGRKRNDIKRKKKMSWKKRNEEGKKGERGRISRESVILLERD